VVVAGGLAHAETLTGAQTLTDPLNQVAYAAHPYAFNADQETSSFWDASFGTFAQTAPVIITEWDKAIIAVLRTRRL
jgi:endoglucanase